MDRDRKSTPKFILEYHKELEGILGDQFRSLILYGSRARDEGREDSDVDLLCVLHGSFDYSEAIRETSEPTARISLEYYVVLSRVFVSEEDFRSRMLPFVMNVRREGVPV